MGKFEYIDKINSLSDSDLLLLITDEKINELFDYDMYEAVEIIRRYKLLIEAKVFRINSIARCELKYRYFVKVLKDRAKIVRLPFKNIDCKLIIDHLIIGEKRVNYTFAESLDPAINTLSQQKLKLKFS